MGASYHSVRRVCCWRCEGFDYTSAAPLAHGEKLDETGVNDPVSAGQMRAIEQATSWAAVIAASVGDLAIT